MARFLRTDLGLAHSRLGPPEVVGAGISFSGPGTRLVDPADPVDFNRRNVQSVLRAPVVVNPPAPPAPPVRTSLVPPESVRDVVLRRAPFSKLRGPVVVFAAPLAPPIETKIAALSAPGALRKTFALTSKTSIASAYPVLDSFDRANTLPPIDSNLGFPWVPFLNAEFNIFNKTARGAGGAYYYQQFGADQQVGIRLVSKPQTGDFTLGARLQWPSDWNGGVSALDFRFYGLAYISPNVELVYQEGSNQSVLASALVTNNVGDVWRFTVVGTTLSAYKNGALVLSASDSRLQGGGFVSFDASDVDFFDDFVGGNVGDLSTLPGWNNYLGPRRPNSVAQPLPLPDRKQQTIVTRLAPSTAIPHRPRSLLFPPTVVFPAVAPFVAPPLAVKIAVQETLAALPARKPHPKLVPPAVVGAGVVFAPIQVYLDVKSTLNVESPERRIHSRLSPPTIVTPAVTAVFSGPTVHLVRSLRPRTLSRLRPPVIPPVAAPIGVHLAPSRRGKARPELSPPAVVGAGIYFRSILVRLAPGKAGKPRSELSPPAVVGAGVTFRPLDVTLTPSRRGLPKSRLAPPVIPPVARPVETELTVQLVRASFLERAPHYRLSSPAVIGAGVVFRPVEVKLAPSSRGKPRFLLGPPAVIGAGIVFRTVLVHLAPSSRGKPKSQLRPAIIPPVAPPVEEKLAVQLVRVSLVERQPRSRLEHPAVVGAGVYFRGVLVRLTPSTDVPERRRAKPVLHPPTVVATPPATRPPNVVKLAPQRRGTPKSTLRPPAVVGAGIVSRPVRIKLVLGRAGKTRSLLFPPTVVFLATELTITTHLAYQTRGKTRSTLRPPAVVGAGRVFRPVDVTLAPSKRGLPKSALRAPTVIGVQPFRPLLVHLAPSSRGKTRSFLRPPAATSTPPFRPILVKLAPGRAGRTTSKLGAPIIPPLAHPIRVVLTRITLERRGPHSKLAPPTVTASSPFAPIRVVLAPSKRGKPSSALHAPAVVGTSPFRPVLVRLAPSSRGVPRSHLSRPAVIVTHIEPTQGQQTILVRLVAVRTRVELLLHKPVFVLSPPGKGRVVKFTTSLPISAWSLGSLSSSMDTDTPDTALSVGEPSSTETEEPESGWTIGGPF